MVGDCVALWGRAQVGSGGPRGVQQAREQASRLLALLERAWQAGGLKWGLDAIFFHREPSLMAVEPASMAWVAGQRGPHRPGERGAQGIHRWPCLDHVLADGGKGLERGVQVANDTSRAQGQAPALTSPSLITMGLEGFHPQRELEHVWHCQGKQAKRQLEAAREADATVAQDKQRGRDARGGAGAPWRAWQQAQRLFDEAVQADSAVEQLTPALSGGPERTLGTRARAQEQLRQGCTFLASPQWNKGRRVLRDERTRRPLDRLHEPLSAAVAAPRWREALIRLGSRSEAMPQAQGDPRVRLHHVVVMQQGGCQRLGAPWATADERVTAMLKGAGRARSAVECVNSGMRRHQGHHREVSHGMLDLKRV